MASTIQVPNETHSQASRITKEGKKITYELNVIQEPERARACGSGAKSSADRRPVDPPPIVQLIVKENGVDVTFQYNASFFLFATLEHARHIAQPRVPPSPASVPVLTGTPVAGMAYLDRPYPAGYFIFPDLSVRHEGKYRLSFSLYEELKEQKDMDAEEIANLEVLAQTSQHVSHRLEVKSKPFTVFSAKKFPGLAESTTLSRTVAEQGCRVRIRRDVRMRRREGKGSRDGFDDYDEGTMEHARHSRTPDAYGQQPAGTPQPMMDGDRPRSVSNASVASYSMPRRPSMEQMSQGYQQQYAPQMASQPSQSMYPPPMPYSTSQQQQYQPTYQQPQQSMMQPPQMPYQPPAQQYSQQPPMQMSQNYYVSQNQYSQQQAPVPQPAYDHHSRHSSIDYSNAPSDYRRSSLSQVSAAPQSTYAPLAPPTSAPYPMDTSYPPTTQTYASSPTDPSSYQNGWSSSSSWSSRRAPSYSNDRISPPSRPSAFPASTAPPLAPIHTLQPLSSAKNEPTSPSYTMPGSAPLSADSVHSPGYQELPRLAAPVSSSFHMPGQLTNGATTKRTFSASFDTHHMEQPLRYGARPNVTGHDEEYRIPQFADGSSSEGESPDASAMSYRRADGTERKRRVPLPA